MYIVFYEGESMGRRYDDKVLMMEEIFDFLEDNPKKKVKISKYI